MITRERAIHILGQHGFAPDYNYGAPTFNDEVGIRPTYKLMDVLGWLGYCCRFC